MKKIYRSRRRSPRRFSSRGCFYCLNSLDVNDRDVDNLSRFLSQRGKIISRSRSGVCAKHQRLLSKAIKRARINSLLPFRGNNVS